MICEICQTNSAEIEIDISDDIRKRLAVCYACVTKPNYKVLGYTNCDQCNDQIEITAKTRQIDGYACYPELCATCLKEQTFA